MAILPPLLLTAGAARARTLEVGPGRAYEVPSQAARAAQDGDTVSIAPGAYFDCATWNGDRLTIVGEGGGEGGGAGVLFTDRACGGKAAFVITGAGVTVRNLGFARIRVPDGNGAGIRLEGRDLTLDHVSFANNQVGILAAGGGGFLRIAGGSFTANGVNLDGQQTHSVNAGRLDLLRIEHCDFTQARGGDHVASQAARTELVGNHFADESGRMAGPLVAITGGAVLLEGNDVDLAAAAAERPGAFLVAGDATAIGLRGNVLHEVGTAVPLLRNWSGQDVAAADNDVPAGVDAVSDSGTFYHRLRADAAAARDWLLAMKAQARHLAASVAHKFM